MHAAPTQPEGAAATTRLRGFIKKSRPTSGYCFIRADSGIEYFLHVRNLEGGDQHMIHGATVEFTPLEQMPGENNPRAVNAVVVAKPSYKRQQP